MVRLGLPTGAQPIDWAQVNVDGFGDANNYNADSMTVFGRVV
jgi:hypothetical protein